MPSKFVLEEEAPSPGEPDTREVDIAPHERDQKRVALTRDAIFAAKDEVIEWVEVPEWGGGMYVRGMTAGERDSLEASLLTKRGDPNFDRLATYRARVLVLCCVDAGGARIFQQGDLAPLSRKSMIAVERVLDVARRLSGLTPEEEKEIAGNSRSVQDDNSSSSSPSLWGG